MPQKIRIRRGTKSDLINNIGALDLGELGFCTDTKEVFIGDSSFNYLVGGAIKGTLVQRPSASTSGRFYFVNSGEGVGTLFLDDGTSWYKINVTSLKDLKGTLDDITDGLNFKKVRAEDITDGHVNKLSDGTYTASAGELKKHLESVEIHRKINDAGNTGVDLWSAEKIKTEIFNAIRGLDWQDSVKTKDLKTVPSNPKINDRYLIPDNAEGLFSGKEGQIAQWNGSTWVFYTPAVGWAVYVEDQNKNFTYSVANKWVVTGGANQTIDAGKGLIGGGSADSITIDIGAGNGIDVKENEVAVKAYKGITVDINGVSVKIDGKSIVYDEDTGFSLMVGEIDGGTF